LLNRRMFLLTSVVEAGSVTFCKRLGENQRSECRKECAPKSVAYFLW
jgi:hypothetical protein